MSLSSQSGSKLWESASPSVISQLRQVLGAKQVASFQTWPVVLVYPHSPQSGSQELSKLCAHGLSSQEVRSKLRHRESVNISANMDFLFMIGLLFRLFFTGIVYNIFFRLCTTEKGFFQTYFIVPFERFLDIS